MGSLVAIALLAGLSAGALPPAGQRSLVTAPRQSADLLAVPAVPRQLATGPARAQPPATGACIGDVCQPMVSVPGFDPRYVPTSRSELFADFLERSRIEPLASIVSALVATGLRVDYTPGFLPGAGHAGHARWGSVAVRLKLRLDALNEPVFRRPSGGR